jgi:uncharacterized protein
MLPSLD